MIMKKRYLSRLLACLFKRKISDREAELQFRYKIAEMNRTAATIKRDADKLKGQAIAFEQSGQHQRAVSAAAAAKTYERSYDTALQTIQDATLTHIQAKNQKNLIDMMVNCTELAKGVIKEINPTHIIDVQQEFEASKEELNQSQAALTALQEGFTPETELDIRNEAGEMALKELMATVTPQLKQDALPAVNSAFSAIAPMEDEHQTLDHTEWINDRRKQLAEMV